MRRLCVFCGSRSAIGEPYLSAAAELGRLLPARGWGLVYGGGGTGLMGALARAAQGAGADIVGVMPRFMVDQEAAMRDLPELRIVATMAERKAMMTGLADAFAVLPGGVGTLEEFFEVWSLQSLRLHDKPVGLLNTAGFYDGLLEFLRRAESVHCLRPAQLRALHIAADPAALLDQLSR